jgi:hypothetical protein
MDLAGEALEDREALEVALHREALVVATDREALEIATAMVMGLVNANSLAAVFTLLQHMVGVIIPGA